MADQKPLTADEIATLVKELPRMRKALVTSMNLVAQLLDDLAEVIRAIPPELIEEAAKQHVQKLIEEANDATPSK